MTKQERKEYMSDYNRHYYEAKRGRPTVCEMMEGITMSVPPTKINFNGTDIDEPIVCSNFGCNNHLSNEEKLFGSKCVHCQSTKKIDVNTHLQYPHKRLA